MSQMDPRDKKISATLHLAQTVIPVHLKGDFLVPSPQQITPAGKPDLK